MEKTKGLIIKQSDYGEGNRMLTVFTEEFGIIKAVVYGAKSAKGRRSAASQFLTWADFMLFMGKGDVATVNSIAPIETFFPVHEDFEKLSLSSYLSDITYSGVEHGIPEPSVLKLLLNTLYICAYKDVSVRKAKAVYELRLVSEMGYRPGVATCSACGEKNAPAYFSCECGGFICDNCHFALRDDIPVTKEIYSIVGYILYSDDKKVFSFDASDEVIKKVGEISEKYLIYRMERDFKTLDYLKKILT